MSLFDTTTLKCPGCGTDVSFQIVESVSADRRPDLRDAILDGSFQREACPSCGTRFRVEPQFVYMDFGRGQYIGVWPSTRRHEWQALAAQTRQVFDDALGRNAPGAARKLGEKLEVRAVFGWGALREKLLARQMDIADGTLELAKLAVLRTRDEAPLPGALELRLVGQHDGDLVLAWLGRRGNDEDRQPPLRVPRHLIADIEAEPQKWQALRENVADGDVVDFQREVLAAA